jgi:hypothetical protein
VRQASNPVVPDPNRLPVQKDLHHLVPQDPNTQNRLPLQEDQAVLEMEVELAEAPDKRYLLVDQPDLKVTF